MPQRRQNSMVRGPTMSIFGCSMAPSVFSISLQGTPRPPSSPASARPTGPAPTISTGVCTLVGISFAGIFALQRVELVLAHQPLPLGEIDHQLGGVAHVALTLERAQGRLHAEQRRLQRH